MDVVIRLIIKYNRQKKYEKLSKTSDISFITDMITNNISKKPTLKMPIRYNTDNIDIADIIDDTDIIDPSLFSDEQMRQ